MLYDIYMPVNCSYVIDTLLWSFNTMYFWCNLKIEVATHPSQFMELDIVQK